MCNKTPSTGSRFTAASLKLRDTCRSKRPWSNQTTRALCNTTTPTTQCTEPLRLPPLRLCSCTSRVCFDTITCKLSSGVRLNHAPVARGPAHRLELFLLRWVAQSTVESAIPSLVEYLENQGSEARLVVQQIGHAPSRHECSLHERQLQADEASLPRCRDDFIQPPCQATRLSSRPSPQRARTVSVERPHKNSDFENMQTCNL